MGLDLIYSDGKEEFSFGVSPSEIDILVKLGKNDEYSQAVESVIGVDEETGEGEIATKELLSAVDKIIEVFKQKPEILPWIYLFETKVNSNKGKIKMLSEGISGLRINNKLFMIEGGLDKCELIPVEVDESGKGHKGKPIDIRDKNGIITDDDEIKIRKKRKSILLLSSLKKLKTFLEKTDSKVIKKIIC